MTQSEPWPSDAHRKKVWIALGLTLLVSLVFPPAFPVFQAVAIYWMVLICIGVLRIAVTSKPSRRGDGAPPVPPAQRAYPSEASPIDGWEGLWLAKCESPAEKSFLRAAMVEFQLRPAGTVLSGAITLALQERVSYMRVDFLVDGKLVIEIDGAAYHTSPRARARDFKRDQELKKRGYSILRIPAAIVLSTPDVAMRALRAELAPNALVVR